MQCQKLARAAGLPWNLKGVKIESGDEPSVGLGLIRLLLMLRIRLNCCQICLPVYYDELNQMQTMRRNCYIEH